MSLITTYESLSASRILKNIYIGHELALLNGPRYMIEEIHQAIMSPNSREACIQIVAKVLDEDFEEWSNYAGE